MSDEDETLKVLKAPVHLVVLQPSHIQKLQAKGTFPVGGLVRPIPEPHELPGVPKPVRVPRHNPLARFKPPHVNSVKDRMKKTRLAVLHDRVLPIPDHLKPPCGTCKTSACCKAFVVGITKEEYDSGYILKHVGGWSIRRLGPEIVVGYTNTDEGYARTELLRTAKPGETWIVCRE